MTPGQLTASRMFLVCLVLIVCQLNQIDANGIEQRLNYGVVFTKDKPLHVAAEMWLHTFEIPMPKYINVPNIGTCHKDNATCLITGHLLSQINTLRSETSHRLENTIQTIHRIIPKADIQRSRSERSLLPFIGQFSKTLFGTATSDDVNTLSRHINALSKRTNELGMALTQHGAHFSSYIRSANKRMDNLIKGVEDNEMAIKYIQTQIQTVTTDIQSTFTHMNDLLMKQVKNSNHLNHELDEFKLGIIDLVKGRISPLLITPLVLKAALKDVNRLLEKNYPGFGLILQDIQEIYSSGEFLFARNHSNIYVTLKLPIAFRPKPFILYKITSHPVPINETASHATTLLDLPSYFFMSDDNEFYATLSNMELSKCYGSNQLYCPFNLAFRPATSHSCELGLFLNNKHMVHSLCNFRFVENTLQPKIIELNPTTILIYKISLLSLECGQNQKMITGCDFCIMQIPCLCSITTSQFYLKPRLTACQNKTRNITKLHPINLALLQEFFDASKTQHIYADTTFLKPLNISTPAFKIYNHKMNQVLADDTKAHLSLSKMADKAKNDEVIFKSLSEPMLDGYLAINENWPDFNALLIFICGGLAIGALVAFMWMFFKIRTLSAAILFLQQTKSANAFSTRLPSFIYNGEQDSSQDINSFSIDIALEWDQAIFIVNLIILTILFIILVKIYRNLNSHVPMLCVEITTMNDCLIIPIMRLPLCPTHCFIQVPSSVTNLKIDGSYFSPILHICWPDFYVLSELSGQKIKVPGKIKLSCFSYFKIRKLLGKSFFVHFYISHNGLLHYVNPSENKRMLDSDFKCSMYG